MQLGAVPHDVVGLFFLLLRRRLKVYKRLSTVHSLAYIVHWGF